MAELERSQPREPFRPSDSAEEAQWLPSPQAVERARNDGRLPPTGVVSIVDLNNRFAPNVELRLDIKTESGSPLNIHLLFSPEDPRHELEIQRLLNELTFQLDGDRKYRCSLSELEVLGRKLDPSCTDYRKNAPSHRTVPRCDLYSVVYGPGPRGHRGNCVRPLNLSRSLTGRTSIVVSASR